MKIRELVRHWQENAQGRLTRTPYQIHLDLESAARLAALQEMYPKHHVEELLGELIGAALEELEASLPYVKGSKVVAVARDQHILKVAPEQQGVRALLLGELQQRRGGRLLAAKLLNFGIAAVVDQA